MEACELTLTAASTALAKGELSAHELTESVLSRMASIQEHLHPYATVTSRIARKAAAQADRETAAGRRRGPLHGIPTAYKDIIDVRGIPTLAGSHVRDGHVATKDSTVAARLSDAGTALLGKTHLHEFSLGVTTPQTANAWDCERIAGGSSGGSAVAVATGAATFALGTDTGGSIRIPAALNGLVGLKPTYGLIPRTGVLPAAWSMDHVGPITRNVPDMHLILPTLTGYDPHDPASIPITPRPEPTAADNSLKGLRIGVPTNYFFDRIDAEVETAVRVAIDDLTALGAQPVEIEIPMARYIQATAWSLLAGESAAYHEATLRTMPQRYSPEVRLFLEGSQTLTATDYLRARRARTLIRQAWARTLNAVDLIVTPTVPLTATPIGQETIHWPDGTAEPLLDAYTRLCVPANITGLPALTLPVGRDHDGLPIGMQIISRWLGESIILQAAHAYETTHAVAHTWPL
ncbi:amidase [Streptomyces xanthochromogenes]|uniref:amidase n=1 Tax=Streptomyces xanthochromogenes TaxID=67384 RepID=UPI001672F541|nr:amidase [Streptomyces xanthochromogenes]GHB71837.1 amidase [Streptomyces xanthochromogenes]